jgi:hypothetical protein
MFPGVVWRLVCNTPLSCPFRASPFFSVPGVNTWLTPRAESCHPFGILAPNSVHEQELKPTPLQPELLFRLRKTINGKLEIIHGVSG